MSRVLCHVTSASVDSYDSRCIVLSEIFLHRVVVAPRWSCVPRHDHLLEEFEDPDQY